MINKNMTIAEVLEINKGTALILMNFGMHCIGCPSSSGETLEEACQVHDIDVDGLVSELNNLVQSI